MYVEASEQALLFFTIIQFPVSWHRGGLHFPLPLKLRVVR